jgi:hypothetical protein
LNFPTTAWLVILLRPGTGALRARSVAGVSIMERRRTGTLFLNSVWDGRLGQLAFESLHNESNSTRQTKMGKRNYGISKMRLVRPVVKNNPRYFKEDFRRFDNAIAWLQWNEDCIEIKKLETLLPHRGGPTQLIKFLKALADEFQVPLWGHARLYELDAAFLKEDLLAQEKLEAFYKKRGFELRKIDANTSEIKYIPNLPSSAH